MNTPATRRVLLGVALTITTLTSTPALSAQHFAHDRGKIVVANRGSGDLSVLSAQSGRVLRTVALPKKNDVAGEPMYVSSAGREVLVGDRQHDRVVRFDARTFRVLGDYPAGKGVFHQWTDGHRLWVNNDVDNTTTVIDLHRHRVLHTIAMPQDLVNDGYKNHDVFTAYGFAWISMIKSNADGYVILYSGRTFQPIRRAKVGGDPHLWFDPWTTTLIVPSQDAGRVDSLDPLALTKKSSLDIPGAHGIYSPHFSRALYVTNITGSGQDDLYNVRLGFWRADPKVVSKASTGSNVAHNITANSWGTRVFVSHSGGTSKTVSIHAPQGPFWAPTGTKLIGTVDVGLNPFGLAYVR
ncbi:MAG: hypothetical protein H6832_18280 [Planctomycetes bacterium]|nr:hypothetical protein [Planctomycetota bacterium]MCB9920355.1 hypothetical protein [Planctomycetota bacterium]